MARSYSGTFGNVSSMLAVFDGNLTVDCKYFFVFSALSGYMLYKQGQNQISVKG